MEESPQVERRTPSRKRRSRNTRFRSLACFQKLEDLADKFEEWVWISEIESARSTADLKTSYTMTRANLQTHLEVLDFKTASGRKKIINGDLKRRVFILEEGAQKDERLLTGKQVARMIYWCFKVSDTNESVMTLIEI